MEQQTSKLKLSPDALWKRFGQYFWILFVLYLLTKVIPNLPPAGISNPGNYRVLLIANTIFAVLVALVMAVNVGWHAYLLSKNKIYFLLGLLGLLWFGLIAIFVAYFAVQWTYYKSVGKTISTSQKVLAGILIVWSLLGLYSVASLISASTHADQQSNPLAWATITSPDNKLAVELPRNPQYEGDDTTNTIYGYSYSASEQDDHVQYVVKYEDYSSVAKSTGVDLKNASKTARQSFLKGLIDSTVKSFNLVNFVSEYDDFKGYLADRFSGTIVHNQKSADVKGIIILVGESAYYVISLTDTGYTDSFDRVLNSLQIKLGL